MNRLIIIGIALVLIGCQGAGLANTADFRTGTDGLEIAFLENAPPSELFAGTGAAPSEFQIGIGLRNAGAADIQDGVLFIDKVEFFTLEGKEAGSKQFFAPLAGKNAGNPVGEYKVLFFNAANTGTDAEEKIVTITAHACYRYQTTASVDICIDTTKPGPLDIEKSCESNKVNSLGKGQGAPLAVAEVKESIIPRQEGNELRLDIVFEDEGDRSDNEKVRRYTGSGCEGESSIFIKDIRFSDYSIKELGSKRIECKGVGFDGRELKMETTAATGADPEKENKIVCSVLLEKTLNPYLTPLIIEAEYGYQTEVEHTFKMISPEYISPDTARLPAAFFAEFCTTIAPKFHDLIVQYSAEFGIDPCLIMAVIEQESDFDQYARSPVGAEGLMQLMPATQKELGVTNPFEAAQNIRGGTQYLKSHFDRFSAKYAREEAIKMAIAAYHAGFKGVNRVVEQYPANWLDDHLTMSDATATTKGILTKDYTIQVIEKWKKYRAQAKEKV
ncbi:transglycosylase SLT domain-containing protein [Candidatus Woesearchaeota archaeon]|nr:transglycosylase SLT domain-containing protein [Candidatus Woesearchaeota archaeon]